MQPDVLVDSIIVYINMFVNCLACVFLIMVWYEIKRVGRNSRSEEFLETFRTVAAQLESLHRINQELERTRGQGTINRE